MTTRTVAVDTGSSEIWGSGDYARVGNLWLLVSELLCEAAGVGPADRLLDVATGSGNAALAARRRFAEVTGVDYVPALLDHARARAAAEGLEVTFEEGDARRLRFSDGSFDVAVSVFGAMYVPEQRVAAAELARVVRPGGRIALANWTPDGFIGRLLALVDRHTSGTDATPPPTLWGLPEHVRDLFGDRISGMDTEVRHWTLRFPSVNGLVEHFRADFGPLNRAYDALGDGAKADALSEDVAALVAELNVADDGTAVVPSAYLQAVLRRDG
ncbi:MAG TPA: class I SAM-dependent methyltransferase [Thermomonospora sp.]|nr:class I SAM-dependent methyltransferase [Thermomonospora sp.]